MRTLFEIDTKDYDANATCYSRPSARAIIIQDGKVAMVHSRKYDYYKFPGGGIEQKEQKEAALIREVLEETGLMVIPETIKEYGMVHRIQKGDNEDVFIQDNYYYFCQVEVTVQQQELDDYEEEEGFTLEYVTPSQVLVANNGCHCSEVDQLMLQRDSTVIQLLVQEGLLRDKIKGEKKSE